MTDTCPCLDIPVDSTCKRCWERVAPEEEARKTEAVAAKREAIARVDRNADPEWKSRALETVRRVALRREYLTADDLWDTGLERPETPSALGPVMLRAAKSGWITKTNEMEMTRDSVRHRHLVVWKSKIKQQEESGE